jgi:ATP-dependent DNA helicase RecG
VKFSLEFGITEGRCTGVPKIRNAMKINGSPPPIFKTDENHSYFLATLSIHPEATRKITLKEKLTPKEDQTHQLEPKTHQLEPKTHQLEPKTHQLEPKTHQLEPKTHQLEELAEEKLPNELKLKIEKLNKRSKNEDVKSVIYALCSWKPLTAQQMARFLNRKDKKHLVTQYLTPLVKEGLLKYVYPERENSPHQAYITSYTELQ